MKIVTIRNFLLTALFFTVVGSISCRRASCGGDSCLSGNTGSLTFTACGAGGTAYNYSCFISGAAVGSSGNQYVIKLADCSNQCDVTITLWNFNQRCATSFTGGTLQYSTWTAGQPYIEMATTCPSPGYTSATNISGGLVVTVTSYTNGVLNGTISGNLGTCGVASGSFTFGVPNSAFAAPSSAICGGNSNLCNPQYFFNLTVDGSDLDMCVGGLTSNMLGVAQYGYAAPSNGPIICGINLQFLQDAAGWSLGTSNTVQFAITCNSCTNRSYTGGSLGAAIIPSGTLVTATVTVTAITTSTVTGTISGNCAGTVSNTETRSAPISGTFQIPNL